MENEKTLRKYIVDLLSSTGHIQRHEDKNESGIPDLSYGIKGTNGWIELKYKKTWPKKLTTPVKFDHFTNKQKTWLKKRGQEGGHCYVLIQIADTCLLYDWQKINQIGKLTKNEMIKESIVFWAIKDQSFDFRQFFFKKVIIDILSKGE